MGTPLALPSRERSLSRQRVERGTELRGLPMEKVGNPSILATNPSFFSRTFSSGVRVALVGSDPRSQESAESWPALPGPPWGTGAHRTRLSAQRDQDPGAGQAGTGFGATIWQLSPPGSPGCGGCTLWTQVAGFSTCFCSLLWVSLTVARALSLCFISFWFTIHRVVFFVSVSFPDAPLSLFLSLHLRLAPSTSPELINL